MIDFSKVEQSVRKLKRQVTAGEIDQKTFEARLVEMIDFAADGYYWMFGHDSERWYRHDGQQWVPREPGKLRLLTPSQNGDQIDPLLPTVGENIISEWRSVNWGWFIVSLITLSLIAWIVYSSTLV
jgi:hypothetical protein